MPAVRSSEDPGEEAEKPRGAIVDRSSLTHSGEPSRGERDDHHREQCFDDRLGNLGQQQRTEGHAENRRDDKADGATDINTLQS